jgi:hypothetical protein
MQTDKFHLDPACNPNTWLLWIGASQYGSLCMDSSTGIVKQLEYRDHDLYGSDVFVRHAAELFSDRAAIQTIRVAFRLNEWCWTPTAFTSEKEAVQKWIAPFWPDRIGHRWVADGDGLLDATAWVWTPDHIRDQLHHLCNRVEYKHTAGFSHSTQSIDATHVQLVRLQNDCWITLTQANRFLYGQPHRIETEGDLLYVLAGLIDRFSLNWSNIDISLSGQWALESELIAALKKRTERIAYTDSPFSFSEPAHWFTPLYDLYICA